MAFIMTELILRSGPILIFVNTFSNATYFQLIAKLLKIVFAKFLLNNIKLLLTVESLKTCFINAFLILISGIACVSCKERKILYRSEERSVGKESVSTCRSRWGRYI